MSEHTKQLYIIRHGQTEYNRLSMVQGSGIDSSLNDTGRKQASLFFENYQHIPFDKIYTSKLQRTHQTIEGFLEQGLPWQQLQGLDEVSWGDREGKVIDPKANKAFFEMLEGWKNGNLDLKVSGGESPIEVAARQQEALKIILSSKEERTVLICMHGRAMRILLCQLLREPLSKMDNYDHSNLCLYRLAYNYTTQHFSLEVANDISHLSALQS